MGTSAFGGGLAQIEDPMPLMPCHPGLPSVDGECLEPMKMECWEELELCMEMFMWGNNPLAHGSYDSCEAELQACNSLRQH